MSFLKFIFKFSWFITQFWAQNRDSEFPVCRTIELLREVDCPAAQFHREEFVRECRTEDVYGLGTMQ